MALPCLVAAGIGVTVHPQRPIGRNVDVRPILPPGFRTYGLGIVASHARGANLVDGFSMEAPQVRQTIERLTEWLRELKVVR